MTTAFHTAHPHRTTAHNSIITISTSTPPPVEHLPGSARTLGQRSSAPVDSAFGALAWVLAAVVGAVLGIAIGLVSAGFDTTRLLLAAGAVALSFGWLMALVTRPSAVGRTRR